VADTGAGISESIKSKKVTPMFTSKARSRLGLPVVKRMTEALDGTVSFESQDVK
jgi:nitrogen-specific signal transduction histidine kinase